MKKPAVKKQLSVGDRVICVAGYKHQSQGTVGTLIERMLNPVAWPFKVNWDCGHCNTYDHGHLERVPEMLPGNRIKVSCIGQDCFFSRSGKCGNPTGAEYYGTLAVIDGISSPAWRRSEDNIASPIWSTNNGERIFVSRNIEVLRLSLEGFSKDIVFTCLRGACSRADPPAFQAFLFDMNEYASRRIHTGREKEKAER